MLSWKKASWKKASWKKSLALLVLFATLPAVTFAQTGAIAGLVRDSSGGVLPGVSVEASSDALIEKTRAVVTDDQGRYNIVDLRPGVYAVTFTLSGFSTLKREGLELSAATTIPVNAELKVGALEETLTVTGSTPVVDVQSVRQRQVLGREVLESIPRSRDGAMTAGLLPGVTAVGVQDSGGSGAGVISQLVAHGSDGADQQWNIDGMKASTGGRRVLITNDQSAQEMTYEVSGISAESAVGGVRMNAVPKEGGNAYRGTFMGAYTGNWMTSSNLNDRLRSRGVTTVPRIDRTWDVSPSLGGPIAKDRSWFYFTYRNWGSDGNYANIFYDSDPTREAENPNRLWDANLRLTTQISKRNKLNVYYDRQGRSQPFRFVSNLQSPEAGVGQDYPAMYVAQGRWTSPITSRLLFEAGASYYKEEYV
ncbi:MAG: carboxypeptidase-like regulatory domain-containing protein, partial [Betaproteobacteria bacterium]